MKTIEIELSQKSIKSAIKKLERYQNKDLERLANKFIQKLAKKGLKVAKQQGKAFGYYGSYITFAIQNQNGETFLVGTSPRLHIEWGQEEEYRRFTDDYSPILMAEFGSGKYAVNPQSFADGHLTVGQGTFPNQTHAFDPPWHWQDKHGNWYSSSGTQPTQPMHSAWEEMYKIADEVAREVFKNNELDG